MDPDQHGREKQSTSSIITCVIVGDVPNSGYMLRFTQEHACQRISTKPQTPHVYIINIVVQIFIFLLKNVFFQDK